MLMLRIGTHLPPTFRQFLDCLLRLDTSMSMLILKLARLMVFSDYIILDHPPEGVNLGFSFPRFYRHALNCIAKRRSGVDLYHKKEE